MDFEAKADQLSRIFSGGQRAAIAAALREAWEAGRSHAWVNDKPPDDVVRDSVDSIVSTMALAHMTRAAECRGIIDCTGPAPVVRRVLGKLAVNVDGDAIGQNAYLWGHLPKVNGTTVPMRVCYRLAPVTDPDAYTDGPLRMHSTREAAEAARGVGNESRCPACGESDGCGCASPGWPYYGATTDG